MLRSIGIWSCLTMIFFLAACDNTAARSFGEIDAMSDRDIVSVEYGVKEDEASNDTDVLLVEDQEAVSPDPVGPDVPGPGPDDDLLLAVCGNGIVEEGEVCEQGQAGRCENGLVEGMVCAEDCSAWIEDDCWGVFLFYKDSRVGDTFFDKNHRYVVLYEGAGADPSARYVVKQDVADGKKEVWRTDIKAGMDFPVHIDGIEDGVLYLYDSAFDRFYASLSVEDGKVLQRYFSDPALHAQFESEAYTPPLIFDSGAMDPFENEYYKFSVSPDRYERDVLIYDKMFDKTYSLKDLTEEDFYNYAALVVVGRLVGYRMQYYYVVDEHPTSDVLETGVFLIDGEEVKREYYEDATMTISVFGDRSMYLGILPVAGASGYERLFVY